MKRYFVCLANSRKYSGRCVAGVELTPSTKHGVRFDIVKNGNQPKWIRPISSDTQGQIDEMLVENINLFDIVSIDDVQPQPDGYQSENVLFNIYSFKKIEQVPRLQKFLDKLTSEPTLELFGNKLSKVSINEVKKLDYSLILIKPSDCDLYIRVKELNDQLRILFKHLDVQYDLPVTDINFSNAYKHNPEMVKQMSNVYLTLSLGLEYQGYHYKLIAGVICCE